MIQTLMRLIGLVLVIIAGMGWISAWWLLLVLAINYGRGILVSGGINERLYGSIDFRQLTPEQLDRSSSVVNMFALISSAKAALLFGVIFAVRWLVD